MLQERRCKTMKSRLVPRRSQRRNRRSWKRVEVIFLGFGPLLYCLKLEQLRNQRTSVALVGNGVRGKW